MVEMWAFCHGAIRVVEIPVTEKWGSDSELLGLVFKWGQNDFQPKPMPSVSVGDAICLPGGKYRVLMAGFGKIVGESGPCGPGGIGAYGAQS